MHLVSPKHCYLSCFCLVSLFVVARAVSPLSTCEREEEEKEEKEEEEKKEEEKEEEKEVEVERRRRRRHACFWPHSSTSHC